MFKLLALDVDGVLTNGTKIYDSSGRPFAKSFCDLDFTAIKRFQTIMPVWLISSDQFNEKMAEVRKIDFQLSVNYNKLDILNQLAKTYHISMQDIAYVGDDYYDIEALKAVGYPHCTQASPRCVKQVAYFIPRNGGDGVVAWIYDMFVKEEIKPNDM